MRRGEKQGDGWQWVRWDPRRRIDRGRCRCHEVAGRRDSCRRRNVEGFCATLHCSHFDTSAHAVKDHRDDGVVLFPEDGAVFGVVGYLPNAGRSLDKGLVSVSVVLRREVVDGGVLIEVVGSVGFAFGGRAVSDVVVGIGNFVCRD